MPGLGPWTLSTPGGRRYALVGSIPAELECQRVTVHGEPMGAIFSPAILVAEVKPLWDLLASL